MKPTPLLFLVLALASPLDAGAQTKADARTTPAPKAEKRKASAKGAEKPVPPKATPEELLAVSRMKSIFLFAMETCDRPERCDPTLRDDAERRFLDACRRCASADRCEAERDAIRAGSAKRRSNPCAE